MTYTKTCVELEESSLSRFKEIFPQHGAVKWFFNSCLRKFFEIHDPNVIDEDIRASVEEALGQMGEDE